MAEGNSPTERLPYEMLAEIFLYLPLSDRKESRLVCHQWRLVLDNYREFFIIRAKFNNETSKFFFNSAFKMKEVFMEKLTSKMSKILCTNQAFPIVENVKIGQQNSQGNIANYFKYGLERSSSLTIQEWALVKISRGYLLWSLFDVNWKNLSKLDLKVSVSVGTGHFTSATKRHLNNMTTFLKVAKIPSLLALHWTFLDLSDSRSYFEDKFKKLYLAFYMFFGTHAKSLTHFKFSTDDWGRPTPNQKRVFPDIPEILRSTIQEQVKLDTFTCLMINGTRNPELIINPMWCGTQLKTLNLDAMQEEYYRGPLLEQIGDGLSQWIIQIIIANAKSLKVIQLPRTFRKIISWLPYCTSLETLSLQPYSFQVESGGNIILPEMKLKHFKWTQFNLEHGFPPILQELIRKCVKTIETLDLGVIRFGDLAKLPFGNYLALKKLKVAMSKTEDFKNLFESDELDFPELLEFDLIVGWNSQIETTNVHFSPWFTVHMRKLKKIWVWFQGRQRLETLELFPVIQELVKVLTLTQITIEITNIFLITAHDGDTKALEEYCQNTPGLKFKSTGEKDQPYYFKRINVFVDRSIFITS